MDGFRWKQKGSDFFLCVSMVSCGVVFFLMFFLSLTALQAQQALRVLGFVVPKDISEFNHFVDVLSFDDIRTNKSFRELLEEMMVRYYVEMCYTIISDEGEMQRRWGGNGVVRQLSTPRVYKSFGFSDAKLAEIREKQITQTIDIVSVDKKDSNVYDVVFKQYRRGVGASRVRTISVKLSYIYSDGYKIFRSNFVNPFGMVFTGVDKSSRK